MIQGIIKEIGWFNTVNLVSAVIGSLIFGLLGMTVSESELKGVSLGLTWYVCVLTSCFIIHFYLFTQEKRKSYGRHI